MAVHRDIRYCIRCGLPYNELHYSRGKDFIGDTFAGYAPHTCVKTTKEYKRWEKGLKAYRESPEGIEMAKMGQFFTKEMQDKQERIRGGNIVKEAEKTHMQQLNEFLREIADMDSVGISRKIIAIREFMNKLGNGLDEE